MISGKKINTKVFLIVLFIIFLVFFLITILYIQTNKSIKIKKYIAELEEIQTKINSIIDNYKNWENYDPNESGNYYSYLQELGFRSANNQTNPYIDEFNNIIKEIDEKEYNYWDTNVDTILANYCYFSSNDLSLKLGLNSNINHYIIVNFYTGNVIDKDGIKIENEKYYRQYDIDFGNKIITNNMFYSDITTNLEVIENLGLSQNIKISIDAVNKKSIPKINEVYYYTDNQSDKQKCSTLDNYQNDGTSVYFTISNSGKYTFIVEDTNFIQYKYVEKEINLCNKPILYEGMKGIYWNENNEEEFISSEKDPNWYDYSTAELKYANAKTEDGSYWVWIPRYIYKENAESVDIQFVYNMSTTATNNKSTIGYKVQESFNESNGIWISKFQANIDDSVTIKPGQTLSTITLKNAKIKCNELKNFSLISKDERNAVMLLAKANEIEISNDLVYYAGGSPKEDDYKENTKYSSTNNIYGIYDLITSENELTINSSENEEGRVRIKLIDID